MDEKQKQELEALRVKVGATVDPALASRQWDRSIARQDGSTRREGARSHDGRPLNK